MKLINFLLLVLFSFSLLGCLENEKKKPLNPDPNIQEVIENQSLKVIDLEMGTGAAAISGKTLTVHYVGKLEHGKVFDASKPKNKAFSFRLGQNKVIQGWELGMKSMKVGGIRRIIVPPSLGYGKKGIDGVIPKNAVLDFTVELLEVK